MFPLDIRYLSVKNFPFSLKICQILYTCVYLLGSSTELRRWPRTLLSSTLLGKNTAVDPTFLSSGRSNWVATSSRFLLESLTRKLLGFNFISSACCIRGISFVVPSYSVWVKCVKVFSFSSKAKAFPIFLRMEGICSTFPWPTLPFGSNLNNFPNIFSQVEKD